VDDAVKAVIAETGILRGRHHRAVDPAILADAVATQDTITQDSRTITGPDLGSQGLGRGDAGMPLIPHWRPAGSGPTRRRSPMGDDDKVRNIAEELKGKGKETAGKLTDDERLEAEGRGDQAAANVKQAGEKIKDAFKR